MEESRRDRARTVLPAVCCAAVFFVLFFSQSISGRYSDDYYYATFWRDGPATFLRMNLEHYRSFNGRVLVHLAAQTLLAFPQWVSAAADTVLLLLTGLAGMRALGGKRDRSEAVAGTALFGAALLLVGRKVLGETLLWVSGYCNYILPVALLVPACWGWDRWLKEGQGRSLWWLLPVQALCGATTELCGSMALAATGCLGLGWLWRERPGWRRGWRMVLAPLANLLGYATIFLSPATRSRVEGYGLFSLGAILRSVPRWAQNLLRPEGIVPVLLLFCMAAALYGGLGGGKLRLLLLGLPTAGVLLVYQVLGCPAGGAAPVLAAVLAYLLLTAAVLLLGDGGVAGALLAAGVAGQVVMLPTNTFVPRTSMSFALPLLLVGAFFLARSLSSFRPEGERGRLRPAGLVCVGTAVTLALFQPTVAGYWGNHLIDVENEAAAAQARQTGELYYCVDYDPRFGLDTRMFNDGYFLGSYLNMERLNLSALYFTSATRPEVVVDGVRMQSPVWTDGEKECLPAAQIVRTMGGEVDWSPNGTRYCVNGVEAVLDIGNVAFTCRSGEREWVVETHGEVAYPYYTQCFSARVLEEALGLTFRYDPAENTYYLNDPEEAPNG